MKSESKVRVVRNTRGSVQCWGITEIGSFKNLNRSGIIQHWAGSGRLRPAPHQRGLHHRVWRRPGGRLLCRQRVHANWRIHPSHQGLPWSLPPSLSPWLCVLQVSIPDESVKFNYDQQRQYILFQGTEVMQGKTRQGNYCKAVVIRTGERRGGERRGDQ